MYFPQHHSPAHAALANHFTGSRARVSFNDFFRLWMDSMIGLIRNWTQGGNLPQAGCAA